MKNTQEQQAACLGHTNICNNTARMYHLSSDREIVHLLNQVADMSTDELIDLIQNKFHEMFEFSRLSLFELFPKQDLAKGTLLFRSFKTGRQHNHWSDTQLNFELTDTVLQICKKLDEQRDDIEIIEISDLPAYIEKSYQINKADIDTLKRSDQTEEVVISLTPGLELLKAGFQSCLRFFFKAYKKKYMLQLANENPASCIRFDKQHYGRLEVLITVLKTAFVKQDAIEELKARMQREFEIIQVNWIRFTENLTQLKHQNTGDHTWRCYLKAKPLVQHFIDSDFAGITLNEQEKTGIIFLGAELVSALIMLHDAGKLGLPDLLLNNMDNLTKDQLKQIREHPDLGKSAVLAAREELAEYLSHFTENTAKIKKRMDLIFTFLADITSGHHEDFNGGGYPRGLTGYNIPFLARVTRVIDTHDAALHNRSYQKAMTQGKLLRYLFDKRGILFDPVLVDKVLSFAETLRLIDEQYPDTAGGDNN